MRVFLNGELVEEERALVSVFDRSFLTGDGLFETMRVHRGKLFRWRQHFARLEQGAGVLGIALPYSAPELASFAARLLEENALPESLLRITLSRGVGERGYAPAGANRPTVVMTVHPIPVQKAALRWRLMTSSIRLPARDAIAGHKTNNKLHQILARAEATKAGADEALLLNTQGNIAEGSASNFFCIDSGTVRTPPLAAGILRGVTRDVVFELCDKLGVRRVETAAEPEVLKTAEGAFVTLSSFGIVEVAAVDLIAIPSSNLVAQFSEAYRGLLNEECPE